MSWKKPHRFAPAVPLLAAALCACSGCGDERETRRIDLGIGPERAEAPAGDAPAARETASGEPAAAVESAVAEAASDPAVVPADGVLSEPADSEPPAATAGEPTVGVGAPP